MTVEPTDAARQYVKPFSSITGTLRTDVRTDGENCYINIARQHTRVSVLTRDKKRIIPAIITGRISSFFLLLYYTPNSLCWLDGGPPTKTLCQKLWVLQKVGGRGPDPHDPPVVAPLPAGRYCFHDVRSVRLCVPQNVFTLSHLSCTTNNQCQNNGLNNHRKKFIHVFRCSINLMCHALQSFLLRLTVVHEN